MTPQETWVPAAKFEGYYEVSSLGRVRSVTRPYTDSRGIARTRIGKVLRLHPTHSGYLYVELMVATKSKHVAVHRLVLASFIGPRPAGMVSRHLNGDRLDNRLSNLEYGTSSQNNKDTVHHGNHYWANRTHCPRNHPYDSENTRVYQGRRFCRACQRERYWRKKEAKV